MCTFLSGYGDATEGDLPEGELPTFREVCLHAYRLLDDVEDALGWQKGAATARESIAELYDARSHIAAARAALLRAAR